MVAPKLNRRRALVRSGQDRRDLGLGKGKGAGKRRAVRGFRAISLRSSGGTILEAGKSEIV